MHEHLALHLHGKTVNVAKVLEYFLVLVLKINSIERIQLRMM